LGSKEKEWAEISRRRGVKSQPSAEKIGTTNSLGMHLGYGKKKGGELWVAGKQKRGNGTLGARQNKAKKEPGGGKERSKGRGGPFEPGVWRM